MGSLRCLVCNCPRGFFCRCFLPKYSMKTLWCLSNPLKNYVKYERFYERKIFIHTLSAQTGHLETTSAVYDVGWYSRNGSSQDTLSSGTGNRRMDNLSLEYNLFLHLMWRNIFVIWQDRDVIQSNYVDRLKENI
jgi:hypothetical protein